MAEEKVRSTEGYQPLNKAYQPTEGNLNPSNPPRGGSGFNTIPEVAQLDKQSTSSNTGSADSSSNER